MNKEGYLEKLGGKVKASWQRRYFQQKVGILRYYATSTSGGVETFEEAGMIPLAASVVRREPDSNAYPNKSHLFSITPNGSTKSYLFMAESEAAADAWVESLSAHTGAKVFSQYKRVGYLQKMGANVANWKERYFILTPTQLQYYKKFKGEKSRSSFLVFCASV